MRDSQRGKVYKAERAAFSYDEEKLSLEECEEFVQEVWDHALTDRGGCETCGHGDLMVPRLKDGRGRRSGASYANGSIALPQFTRRKWYILHEVSHSLLRREYRAGNIASHGPEFCEVYLGLVQRFLGFDAYKRLGSEMLKARVKTRPARERAAA